MVDPILGTAKLVAETTAKMIMPKLLGRVLTELKDTSADLNHAFFNAFSVYTKSAYEKHSYFSSLVFPNKQLKLKDFYLPLTLLVPVNMAQTELRIDEFPFSLMSEKKDLLVVDTAGMGKSTLLKFMFLRAVELDIGIPIFIELRKLKVNESILNYVFNQLKKLDGSLNESLVVRLVGSGEFVFFLDGFDEISDSERSGVVQHLKDFKQHANRNRFVVSSRDQVGLAALSDFFRVSIKPLSFEEAAELIRKYGGSQEISEALIEKLRKPESIPIREFLTNPLLVSLLFKAYEHKQSIPLKKHVFYRQVYEALFENHDLSKEAGELNRTKFSKLDIHTFEIVMRALGFLSLESSKVEYPKDELILLIERTKALVGGIDFNPQALLQDLITKVPLFVVDGNYYRWNHKSLQEYFAALYLSAAGMDFQRHVLRSMYASDKTLSYVNFYSLFSDIDAKGFRHGFLPELIGELLTEFSAAPLLPEISKGSQDMRRRLTAFRTLVVVSRTHAEFGEFEESSLSFGGIMPGAITGEVRKRRTFEEAQKLLSDTGLQPSLHHQGSHSVVPTTVVTYHGLRYQFIVALVKTISFEFVSVTQPLHQRLDDLVDLNLLTPGFTVVNSLEVNPLNTRELFDHVNEFLESSVEGIAFDPVRGKELLLAIDTEIAFQSATKFAF